MHEPPLDPRQELDLEPSQLPRHIAIIMDGNGRWANLRHLPRIQGHVAGAANVRQITTHCARLQLDALTLYGFSAENWKRPKDEVQALMGLYVEYLAKERGTIMDNNVRFRHVGRREGLPESVLTEMDKTVSQSRGNTGLTLCLALNYGARDELVDAIRRIAIEVQAGRVAPEAIDSDLVSSSLYTAGLPDPDLLIRTANERRLSNFLLWQISYTEIHICESLWPDFDENDLNSAIRDFAGRERRFGRVGDGVD